MQTDTTKKQKRGKAPGQRLRLTVRGIVQGVGFRPFLHRLAATHEICGWVRNTGEGLLGELEGSEESLTAFIDALRTTPPPLSFIEEIRTERISEAACEEDQTANRTSGSAEILPGTFRILPSKVTPFATLVSPDTALCPDCRGELFSSADRRFRHPFINCTNCGPRYTILNDLPYDRSRTVMDAFPMCDTCLEEYEQIDDRRYHAQPNCCPSCGPEAYYLASDRTRLCGDPFSHAQRLLKEGGILAVRGIGGIHLACDAANDRAVTRLRGKKHRAHKPFALMCRSRDTAEKLCVISEEEAQLLESPAHPIVLLEKRADFPCPDASGVSPRAGIMLPYTPIHELLLDGTSGGPDVLIMTSANRPGCPVLTDNDEALCALSETADGYLLNNRPIANRCDDSLVTLWEERPYFLRRSRGYAPAPIFSDRDVTGIFAFGAEQKASFALGRGRHIFLSPHIGDLKNAETLEHYRTAMDTYRHLFRIDPSVCVCDLHPDYLSRAEAEAISARYQIPLLPVQHHWAHMVSCMTDRHLEGPAFGIIWDGTGLSPDHTIWGGEFMTGDASSYRRTGSIRPIRLIGGDRATTEIGRIALALLKDADIDIANDHFSPWPDEKTTQLLKLYDQPFTVQASSIGRLFDGVCSLLCRKTETDYEGEGAILLESLSPCEEPTFLPDREARNKASAYSLRFYEEEGVRLWDTRPMIRELCEDILAGEAASRIAFRFLVTLCFVARDQTLALNPERLPVVLSGGVFQNRFLLSGITQLLRQAGYAVYSHRRVAANDEGICLGQLAIAEALKKL